MHFLFCSSQPATANNLQQYLKGSCFYGIIHKPSDLLANYQLFLIDFPMDQKMCSQDFTVMPGNVLGVKQGGRVIPFATLKNRIRGEGFCDSVPCKRGVEETLAPSTHLIPCQACYQWAKAAGQERAEALSKAPTSFCPASLTTAASQEFRGALVKCCLLKQNPLSEYLYTLPQQFHNTPQWENVVYVVSPPASSKLFIVWLEKAPCSKKLCFLGPGYSTSS